MPPAANLSTCVYIMVVLPSLWPSSSSTVLMSVSACSRCVVKAWRSECTETDFCESQRVEPRCSKRAAVVFGTGDGAVQCHCADPPTRSVREILSAKPTIGRRLACNTGQVIAR